MTTKSPSKGTARIDYPGGQLYLPARESYDLEILVANAGWYARRYGEARIELPGHTWRVAPPRTDQVRPCATCRQPQRSVVLDDGRPKPLCTHCAQEEISAG